VAAAEGGDVAGGSRFVVGVPSRHRHLTPYLYVVTNKHVIDGGCRVVRFAGRSDDAIAMETSPEHWHCALDDDLAVMSFGIPKEITWGAIDVDLFLDESTEIDGWSVLLGDDVFMMGRFIGHDGRQKNRPLMRFGNVAMLSDEREPIGMGDHDQVGFLVECRSMSGFSGSPVFVALSERRWTGNRHESRGPFPRGAFKLLGVDCAHLPMWNPVRPSKSHRETCDAQWVEINSGIAVVIPAWHLLRLINAPQFREEREEAERRRDEREQLKAAAIPSDSGCRSEG
jgi:hypothetical protein